MKRIALVFACAAAGCGGDDAATGPGVRVWDCDETRLRELVDVGPPPSAAGPEFIVPTSGSRLGGFAVIPTASADGQEGSISLVDVRTFSVTRSFTSASPDALARHIDGRLYVLNRSGADTIAVYDSDTFVQIGDAFTVADESQAAQPEDICCSNREKCYVVRREDPEILIINPEAGGKVLGKIDLTSTADPEPQPRACFLAGALMVVAQENVFTFIDTQDPPAVVSTLPAAASIPTGRFVPLSDTVAIIAEAGQPGQEDGVVEQVNALTRTSEGTRLTEADLGGELVSLSTCTDSTGWAITDVGGGRSLRAVDFATASDPAVVHRPLYEADGDRLVAVGTDHLLRIWVADRDVE